MNKPSTIDEYIDTFPEELQLILNKVRDIISDAAPDASETISYGIPTFQLNGKYLIYFAGYKNHISIYPVTSADLEAIEELLPYQSGKGTAKFPLDKPIPYDLISRIVDLKVMKQV